MTTILAIGIIILMGIIALMIFQLISIKEQLNLIIKERKTNKLVTVSFHGLKVDEMVTEINNLINSHVQKERELEYEKSRLKSQVTSISHDLRTPLTSIMGYLELVKRCKTDEEGQKYLDIIKSKSETMQKLVEDFYEVSLIEDKNYELEIEKFLPSYIIEDTAMSYYNELESMGIKLDINILEDQEILGNQNALARIYLNLLSNIKKHGVNTATITHGMIDGKHQTIIRNEISPQSQATLEEDRLFEKFYTGEKSRHQTSSGIGMYSSKIMLEKMGHKIQAQIVEKEMIITITYS